MSAAKTGVAAKKSDAKARTKKPQIVWGNAKITAAAGPSAAHTSLSTEIAGELVILFDDAVVDLQTNGPMSGVWAGTLVFRFAQPVEADTKLKVMVRGNVGKSKASAGLFMLSLDGESHAKTYPSGRAKKDDFTWTLGQTLPKGAETHSLTLLLAAERRTTDEFIRLAVDSFDISVR
jgi:hypothetical protein